MTRATTMTFKTLSLLFTLVGLGATSACASNGTPTEDEHASTVSSPLLTLRQCQQGCSDRSVACHAACGQNPQVPEDVECHRACTRTFNHCYLVECELIAGEDTLDPDTGGGHPTSTEPVIDAVADPSLPKDFAVLDGFLYTPSSLQRPKDAAMVSCMDTCAKSSSGRWCLAFCDCKIKDGKDSLTCALQNPYIDMGPGK